VLALSVPTFDGEEPPSGIDLVEMPPTDVLSPDWTSDPDRIVPVSGSTSDPVIGASAGLAEPEGRDPVARSSAAAVLALVL